MARYLSNLGYELVLVARNEERLKLLSNELKTKSKIIPMDLKQKENCYELFKQENNIDVLINNAGFGIFGRFDNTDIEKELELINTNILAMHILFKLYLQEMTKKDSGKILNVASIAGFMPGPLMATYYASKAYVVRLTQSVQEELRKQKSNVKLSVLCPGPVNTNFNNVANVKFGTKALSSEYVAKYAIDKLLSEKQVIIPGIKIKLAKQLTRIASDKLVGKVAYHIQKRKEQ